MLLKTLTDQCKESRKDMLIGLSVPGRVTIVPGNSQHLYSVIKVQGEAFPPLH
jgi:hypothetical protein